MSFKTKLPRMARPRRLRKTSLRIPTNCVMAMKFEAKRGLRTRSRHFLFAPADAAALAAAFLAATAGRLPVLLASFFADVFLPIGLPTPPGVGRASPPL